MATTDITVILWHTAEEDYEAALETGDLRIIEETERAVAAAWTTHRERIV